MDREKVINGLAELKETIRTAKPNLFVSGGFCAMNMKRLDNAIELLNEQQEQIHRLIEENASNAEMAEGLRELLKEQEAVEPIYIENPYTHLPVSYCPKCREPISKFITGNPYRKTEYCHYCGQAVKWG